MSPSKAQDKETRGGSTVVRLLPANIQPPPTAPSLTRVCVETLARGSGPWGEMGAAESNHWMGLRGQSKLREDAAVQELALSISRVDGGAEDDDAPSLGHGN